MLQNSRPLFKRGRPPRSTPPRSTPPPGRRPPTDDNTEGFHRDAPGVHHPNAMEGVGVCEGVVGVTQHLAPPTLALFNSTNEKPLKTQTQRTITHVGCVQFRVWAPCFQGYFILGCESLQTILKGDEFAARPPSG